MSWKRMLCGVCCLGLLLTGPAAAQPFFTEVTDQALADPRANHSARGLAWGDYDNDGRPDLFLSGNGNGRVTLWRNRGKGQFADYTAAIQLDEPLGPNGGGSVFGDYDNDGDLDLYVPFGEWYLPARNLLFRNDRGAFVEVGRVAGLTDVLPTDNALWLDYDRDGFLDLYTGNQMGLSGKEDPTVRNKLYRNQGNGTFVDVTQQAGLDLQLHKLSGGNAGGMAAGDFNDDGWPDLYVGVFLDRNRLFLSEGQGGFRDATTNEIGDEGEAFGIAVGDIDNDLDLDIYQVAGGGDLGLQRSLMLLNLGGGQFLDVTEGVGLGGWIGRNLGAGLADLDNDGDLDLMLCTPLRLFLNNGDGIFTDQTDRLGFSTAGVSFVVSWGDYDLDGFLDMSMANTVQLQLYHNNGNSNHYLRVELAGARSNRNGIGARLIATAGDLRQMREILGGLGFFQDELVAHFGLGQRTKVDRLEIRWPSGQVEVLTDVSADQKIRVIEGREGYQVVRPTGWEGTDMLVAGSSQDFVARVRPALFEREAKVTRVNVDLSELGGSAELLLADRGDGSYGEILVMSAEANGIKSIEVRIEQQTALGSYWSRLSQQVVVIPAGDLVVLDEGLAPAWQLKGNRRVESLDLDQRSQRYRGSTTAAFRANPDKPWSLTFTPTIPVNPVGYTALRFAFHPGDVSLPSQPEFGLLLNPGKKIDLLQKGLVHGEEKQWQVVEIPLDTFGVARPLESIIFSGNFGGTFYLDDIRLVAATPPAITVVEEERTTPLPQSFSLSQNFPNPFNSQTVIRFALPEGGEVELAVYNLAGQQVVKLAEGVREVGTYTVRWDGRDEQGRELASGVYLYRLRAGERIETRKLVLVR